MNTLPVIGITGSSEPFDGGLKRMGLVMNTLTDWVTFKPISTPLRPLQTDVSGVIVADASSAAELLQHSPWLPVEEDRRLQEPSLRENFIERVFALHDVNRLQAHGLTRHALLAFHSRYKLQLLAHHQPGYREIGPLVASLHEWEDLETFFVMYREKLMAILQKVATRQNHTNVLMHIQGYFRNQLNARQRAELRESILSYLAGQLPLLAPVTLLKRYMDEYPDHYLLTQNYFTPYPEDLGLRLLVN
jgi:uncharacterized protein YbgA (DUF1722 family)